MPATSPLELESLYVRIFADANQFYSTAARVIMETRAIGAAFKALQIAIGGFTSWSVLQFARLDDSLTRTMTHMRDFTMQSRGLFEKSLMDISSRSTNNFTDLAHGLDVIASSGMSAAASVKALAISETFAVASGMNVQEAAQKQIDVLSSLGLITQDVQKNYAEMKRMSDLLVGVAPMTGSSVKQLSDALDSRFLVAMQRSNVSLEEGIALMGVYSMRSREFRGTEAGLMGARFLMEMSKENIENVMRWHAFGVEIYDVTGKMRPLVDIMGDIDARMALMPLPVQEATLRLLGFENRAINVITPLIGMSRSMRAMLGDVKNLGDISEKTAEVLRHDFSAQLTILWNNVQNLAYSIGRTLAPAIAWLAERIGSLVKWFNSLNPAVQSLIVWAGVLVAALNPTLYILNKLSFGLIPAGIGDLTGMVFGLAKGMIFAIPSIISWGFAIVATLPSLIFLIPLLLLLAAGLGVVGGAMSKMAEGWFGMQRRMWDEMIPRVKGFLDTLDPFLLGWEKFILGFGAGAGGVLGGAVQGVGSFIEALAGFFWNFQENMQAIFGWIRRNWKELLIDIVSLSITLGENIFHDLAAAFKLLQYDAMETWKFIWGAAKEYGTAFFGWLYDTFVEVGGYLKDVIMNLGKNLEIDLPVIADAISASIKASFSGGDPGKAVRDVFKSEWVDPFLGTDQITPPNWFGIQHNWATKMAAAQGNVFGFDDAHRGLAGSSSDAFTNNWKDFVADLHSPLLGFKSAVQENLIPLLNFKLPPNAPANMQEFMGRVLFPFLGGGGEEAGVQPFGRQGPGAVFKQTSLARFQVGGPALESIEYEQLVTMKLIDNRLYSLLSIAQGWKPINLPPVLKR